MYQRFTDRARKVMLLANQEAIASHHEYIGTEHLLLGLALEGAGVAANVLKLLGVELPGVRQEVERLIRHGSAETVVLSRLPHTPRTKKVLDYSIEEAASLKHLYVGTEHLLLGLTREEEGVAAQVLANMGVKLERVREEVLKACGFTSPAKSDPPSVVLDAASDGQTSPAPAADLPLSREVEECLRLARESARRNGESGVTLTRLLLAIMRTNGELLET
jgi:ATP-dependent Clp protease ATP-binding subunit ClpC